MLKIIKRIFVGMLVVGCWAACGIGACYAIGWLVQWAFPCPICPTQTFDEYALHGLVVILAGFWLAFFTLILWTVGSAAIDHWED